VGLKIKMAEFKIHNLWPTPVYENNFSFDEDGIKYIKNVTYERMATDNGFISIDRYLINDTRLSELKKEIDLHVENYTKKFLDVKDNADFYMLNSWATRHDPGDWCQPHYHGSSLISGVYYLNSMPEQGGTEFYNPVSKMRNTISVTRDGHSPFLTDKIVSKAEPNKMIMWPSYIEHRSEKNITKKERYTMSFNLLSTTLGNQEHFNWAELK